MRFKRSAKARILFTTIDKQKEASAADS